MTVANIVVGGGPGAGGGNSVPERVRHVRRGGRDLAEGMWRQAGKPSARVDVVSDGTGQVIVAETFVVELRALTLLGTLDRSPRPRATNSHNIELESGVAVLDGAEPAMLLLRKVDLAVIAILAGWPPPRALPHGQNAHDLLQAQPPNLGPDPTDSEVPPASAVLVKTARPLPPDRSTLDKLNARVRVLPHRLTFGGWTGSLDVAGDVLHIDGDGAAHRRTIDVAQVKRWSFNPINGLWAFRMKDGSKAFIQTSGSVRSADRSQAGHDANHTIRELLTKHGARQFP